MFFKTTMFLTLSQFLKFVTISEIIRSEYSHLGKGTAISVTGRGSLYVCETLKLPYFLQNWFTEGSEVVNLMRRSPFKPLRFQVLISV
jgi:hypothetical protein